MSEGLLADLNPGRHFDRTGESLVVVDTGDDQNPMKADRVAVDKESADRQALRQVEFADRILPGDRRQQRETIAHRDAEGHRDRSQSDLPLQPGLSF